MVEKKNIKKFRPAKIQKTDPIYFSMNKSVLKKFAVWYRFLIFIFPLFLTIIISLNFKKVWWWYILISIDSLLILPATVTFLIDIVYKIKVKTFIDKIDDTKPIIMLFGNWGAGKTSFMVYNCVIKAKKSWNKLKREYKLLECRLNEIDNWTDEIRKKRAKEIVEAYDFYKNSGTVPCLWSTIPLNVDGTWANRLTFDHLMQRKKLPYGTIVAGDEISLIIPQELFKNKPWELKEMFKFGRHFINLKMMINEQAKENTLVDLRRVTALNQFMEKQKWVLKPKILMWISNFIVSHKKHIKKPLEVFIRSLDIFCSYIGYRKYFFKEFGSEYEKNLSGVKKAIVPAYLNCEYNDRCFANAYRAKDLDLEVSKWSSLEFSLDEINEIFTQEVKDLSASKREKKRKEKEKRLEKVEENEDFDND